MAGMLMSAGEDGTIKWWDVISQNLVWTELQAHRGPIWDVKADVGAGSHRKGEHLFTVSSDSTIKVLRGHRPGSEVWCVDVDASNIFSGGRDGLVKSIY
ncbi:hypothetical protein T484DRAFT_1762996 [Baffinella frigidus]|nr:hypothetical protein T484DRAFT_1762996 [Cryptophyta sp. CCMP2293]